MAQPKRVVARDSEEDLPLALYEGMLKKVHEMHADSLKLESSPDLAELLHQLGIIQVTIERVIEKVKEEKAIAKASDALLSKED